MWLCPECEEKIEYLNYQASTTGWESGSADLSETNESEDYRKIENYDYSDSGTNDSDNFDYSCPECDHSIELNQLIWKEETEEIIHKHKKCFTCKMQNTECNHKTDYCKHCKLKKPEDEPEEALHKIINPKNNILCERDALPKDNTEMTMICRNKKCKYVFVYERTHNKNGEFNECPKCGTVSNLIEYALSLKK